VDFIIKFKILDIKTKTDDIYTIFLLKKNIRSDIIKSISESKIVNLIFLFFNFFKLKVRG